MIGEGPAARSIKIDLPRFTLVGATTRAGLLTSPLRDRFGIVERLEFYSTKELQQIVTRSSGILNIPCDEAGSMGIASRARGTPRIANRLLRRVRDFAQVIGDGLINEEIALGAMDMLKVDACGFDTMDRRLLRLIIDSFDGLMARVNALGSLPWLPSLFIFLLFLAIETSPIFAKLLSPKGEYDFKLEDQETAIKTWVKQKVNERNILLQTDMSINNKIYNDIADEEELYNYKRKKARELMQLQADAFFQHQKKAL